MTFFWLVEENNHHKVTLKENRLVFFVFFRWKGSPLWHRCGLALPVQNQVTRWMVDRWMDRGCHIRKRLKTNSGDIRRSKRTKNRGRSVVETLKQRASYWCGSNICMDSCTENIPWTKKKSTKWKNHLHSGVLPYPYHPCMVYLPI